MSMSTNLSSIKFRCGDRVQLKHDPRHIGVVQAIVNGIVHVKWLETTWKSEEKPEDLEEFR